MVFPLFRHCRTLAVGALCLLSLTATATEPLYLVTGNAAPFTTERHDGFFDLIAAELSRRIGVRLQVSPYKSSARVLVNGNNGDDDGVIARVRGLEKQYPNLVIVPEKVFDNDFVACTLGEVFSTPGWSALDSRRVGFIRGWQIFQSNLAGQREVTRVGEARQLFEMLRQQRIDVALYERWQALWYARELGLPIRVMEPPLAREEMFIYLHRKHTALVPRVAAALADMKRDGSYRRIFSATLGTLRPESSDR